MATPVPESELVESAAIAESADPAETKGERTRRRLLEIAIERFGERGFRATSVSEVARSAGLTQAAVYAYFESKDALFEAAVDADAEAALTETAAKAADTPATQLVPMLLILFLSSLDEHPLVKRVLGGYEPDTLDRLINLPALTHLTHMIAQRIQEAQEVGDVRSDLDAELFSNGAEAIMLCLMMGVVQVGATTEARRQLGVVSIFDAVLRPPQNGHKP